MPRCDRHFRPNITAFLAIVSAGLNLPQNRRSPLCSARFSDAFPTFNTRMIPAGQEAARMSPVKLGCRRAQHPCEHDIWCGASTFKQAKRIIWNRLKRNVPEDWHTIVQVLVGRAAPEVKSREIASRLATE